jgi:hypothetical protein
MGSHLQVSSFADTDETDAMGLKCRLYERLVVEVMQQIGQCAISVPCWIFELGAQLGAGPGRSKAR